MFKENINNLTSQLKNFADAVSLSGVISFQISSYYKISLQSNIYFDPRTFAVVGCTY